jgi:hypothetical protein
MTFLSWYRLKPVIYYTQGEHADHNTNDAVHHHQTMTTIPYKDVHHPARSSPQPSDIEVDTVFQ